MRFVTLFAGTQNIHLVKDVGLLPFYLHKVCGADASVACYENGEYPFLTTHTPGLKLDFFKKSRFGKIIDGLSYIRKNAESIDVLNIYHLNLSSFFYAYSYKRKNRNGCLYLKLDMDHFDLAALKKAGLKRLIKRLTVKKADILSCESTFMEKELKKLGMFEGKKLIYIPDGLFKNGAADRCEKENVFLTVGRLGCEQKATEVLLEAFAASADRHNWSLRLAGGTEKGFDGYVESYFSKHPELKDRVVFLGMIDNKNLLQAEYERASAFVLPSRWESFGLVLTEAAACGCYIITTDVVPPADDITACGKYGVKLPVDDVSALADALADYAASPLDKGLSDEERGYTEKTFDWNAIAEKLFNALEDSLK